MSIADKLTTIAENEQKVYDAGKIYGYGSGLMNGYEDGMRDGKQAEYDAFWNGYQDYGNRRTYPQAFYGFGWTSDTFNPKYDIIITGNKYNVFGYSNIEQIDVAVDITGATTGAQIFYYCQKLHTISCLRIAATTPFSDPDFYMCSSLKNITIEGEIGSSISFANSPLLSYASIMSIINHLATVSTTQTLTIGATNIAKLQPEEIAVATGKGWSVV